MFFFYRLTKIIEFVSCLLCVFLSVCVCLLRYPYGLKIIYNNLNFVQMIFKRTFLCAILCYCMYLLLLLIIIFCFALIVKSTVCLQGYRHSHIHCFFKGANECWRLIDPAVLDDCPEIVILLISYNWPTKIAARLFDS